MKISSFWGFFRYVSSPPDLSSHSFNSAIYSMLLADRLGLSPQMVSYTGMATIFQDLDRIVGIPVAQRDRETGLEAQQQFFY